MRIFLFVLFAASMCESPAPVPTYDAGDATCAEAWDVARDCDGFEILGPDELPDSGDEIPWVVWCELYQSSGIDAINTGCIAHADVCSEALACLE